MNFQTFPNLTGVLFASEDYSIVFELFTGHRYYSKPNASCIGYVKTGNVAVSCKNGDKQNQNSATLVAGSYFSGEDLCLNASGEVLLFVQTSPEGCPAMTLLGGPIEGSGRLKYIDGCTDSLLIPPVLKGYPCLNSLHFPLNTDQTAHTHSSDRLGVIVSGRGECETPDGVTALVPGVQFRIPANALHKFRTREEPMIVVAYHPESDFGPQHEDHPMVNRTFVDGVSAKHLPEIRT